TQSSEEDRILRVWTPILLRTILFAATIVLMFGLFLMATYAPGYYVQRYRAVEAGQMHQPETFSQIMSGSLARDPHSLMTLGLFILTLVPLARVAFCFVLFLKERDYIYVALTAYVLVGLIAGVLLGKIG
ncbi:MAG TPA: DUF1634 domain-containing protein, partial [Candidatus Binataceae bacterium]|nr:DUF1634 domain-containing protein [Candidatus Binataceae bacterium]